MPVDVYSRQNTEPETVLFIVLSLIIGGILLRQAVHTFETGSIAWFFRAESIQKIAKVGRRSRMWFSGFYGLLGTLLIVYIVQEVFRSEELQTRLTANLRLLLIVCTIGGVGVWSFLHPKWALRWFQPEDQQVEAAPYTLMFTRIVSLALALIALYSLSSM